jgi:hypothetical protein
MEDVGTSIDRGPNQDAMDVGEWDEAQDATYQDASYLGTSPNDDEEVQDLGFIVDDHDDRRVALTGDWQRVDTVTDVDTDAPVGADDPDAPIPNRDELIARGAPQDWFATDYHVKNAAGERQEQDFVETSMLSTDPEMNDGIDDFTDETLKNTRGGSLATDLYGKVAGAADGLGTSVQQDLGAGGFQIRDNPLMQPQGQAIPQDAVEPGAPVDSYLEETDDDATIDLLRAPSADRGRP